MSGVVTKFSGSGRLILVASAMRPEMQVRTQILWASLPPIGFKSPVETRAVLPS